MNKYLSLKDLVIKRTETLCQHLNQIIYYITNQNLN